MKIENKTQDGHESDIFHIEPLKWWEKLYLVPKWKFEEFSYWLRKLYQKTTTGFAHEESWNFNYHLCAWALPRLKHLRANLHGHPSILVDDVECSDMSHQQYFAFMQDIQAKPTAHEKWEQILDRIIWALENFDKEPDPIYPDKYEYGFKKIGECERGIICIAKDERAIDFTPVFDHQKKVQEGFEFLGKYLYHLWD